MPVKKLKAKIKKPLAVAKKPATEKKTTLSERYQNDPEFRLRALENQRRYYRKKRGSEFEMVSPLRSLDYFKEFSELMDVTYNGVTFTAPCFTKTKAAELLQISPQTLWRQSTGKDATIPEPVLTTSIGKRELVVYHQDEMELMLTIIGEHKRRFYYYRKDHVETKQKLFSAINDLRQSWENKTWQSPVKQDAPPPLQKKTKLKPLRRK